MWIVFALNDVVSKHALLFASTSRVLACVVRTFLHCIAPLFVDGRVQEGISSLSRWLCCSCVYGLDA